VHSYHIVWVEFRVTTLCGWRAELSNCVGGVQSYHIILVECIYGIVLVQCKIIALRGWSAEL